MTKSSSRVIDRKRSTRVSSADRWAIAIVGGLAVVAVIVVVALFSPHSTNVNLVDGVVNYPNLPRDHSDAPQTYAQVPPVGGVHNPVWLNCGIYDQPVQNENAVHSLEHGAVWITYQPNLPADQVEKIRSLARGQDFVIVSPYPDLPKPVVASAWGVQLPLDNANDPRLPLFITRYQQGPQTPEPGAVCTGGVGTPIQG
jgi:hypothetical protein